MFLAYAKTDASDYSNMCEYRIEDTNKFEWKPADLLMIEQVESISWTHLSCFFLIAMAEYMNGTDLDAHFSVYFNIVSCILYQTTIIGIWLGQKEMLALQDTQEILADGSLGFGIQNCRVKDDFGQAREWLMYEMIAYYMQVFQLMLFLFRAE